MIIKRISDAEHLITAKQNFKSRTNHFSAFGYGDNYKVYSYYTMIAEYYDGVWFINDTTYSVTTVKHQRIVRDAIGEYDWKNNVIHVNHLPVGVGSISGHVWGAIAYERMARIRRKMSNV